ncbi:ROK family protein [Streptomyces sp. NPDC015139]|uniref:ROK family transcriptional regulator n=1 Tax=Streptomyces sp. NPDC015139 TaxID=3364942 RepID=UPI0036F84C49
MRDIQQPLVPAAAPTPGRGQHADRVLRLLRESGPMTRGELGARCGLSRTTLYEVTGRLVDSGLVIATVADTGRRRPGRPAEKLAVNPAVGRLLGIDFGRRHVRLAAITAAGDEISTVGGTHSPAAPWSERIAVARRLAAGLTGSVPRLGPLGDVGVAVADPATVSLAADGDRALADMLGRSLGARVRLGNGPRLAALAETVWGAAKGLTDVLYLELSDQVGGGLVTGGALHRGAHGRSGGFGHILAEVAGAPCSCGGRGCLQTVASTTAVLDAYRAAPDLPQLAAALSAGEKAAHAVVRRAAIHTGRVLAGLVKALGPSMVVVGGELVTLGPPLMKPLENEVRANAVTYRSPPETPVRRAELGDFAAAVGAASLLRSPSDAASIPSA